MKDICAPFTPEYSGHPKFKEHGLLPLWLLMCCTGHMAPLWEVLLAWAPKPFLTEVLTVTFNLLSLNSHLSVS